MKDFHLTKAKIFLVRPIIADVHKLARMTFFTLEKDLLLLKYAKWNRVRVWWGKIVHFYRCSESKWPKSNTVAIVGFVWSFPLFPGIFFFITLYFKYRVLVVSKMWNFHAFCIVNGVDQRLPKRTVYQSLDQRGERQICPSSSIGTLPKVAFCSKFKPVVISTRGQIFQKIWRGSSKRFFLLMLQFPFFSFIMWLRPLTLKRSTKVQLEWMLF